MFKKIKRMFSGRCLECGTMKIDDPIVYQFLVTRGTICPHCEMGPGILSKDSGRTYKEIDERNHKEKDTTIFK